LPQAHQIDDSDELLAWARTGDREAREMLLARYRNRLRRLVAVRLDPRLAARVDASDVVQDILFEASGHLDEYLETRPLPFYAWLRQFAWSRMVDLHRLHVRSQRRSVTREIRTDPEASEAPTASLARRLADTGSSPSRRLVRSEEREQLENAIAALPERDRTVLAMRYLEQLEIAEIAEILGVSQGSVKARVLRAVLRLRPHLGDQR
jgi:RNA polymerase sigma-70 factor (ECF subfamily)